MQPTSVHFKDILVAEGEGVFAATTGWAIFISEEPEEPDTAISLFDVSVMSPITTFDRAAKDFKFEDVQVRVRANGYQLGFDKLEAVCNVLSKKVAPFTVEDADSAVPDMRYSGVWKRNQIAAAGKDSEGRYKFTATLRTARQEVD